MATLADSFGVPVGYSDHTAGLAIACAAVALGARIVERPRGAAGDDRDPRLLHDRARAGLAAHGLDRARGGAYEDDPRVLARFGELGILGEKAVTGVDRFGAALLAGVEDLVDAQIALRCLSRADCHGCIGHADMHTVSALQQLSPHQMRSLQV